MIKGTFPVEQFAKRETPFYYYDTPLLRQTLAAINDYPDQKELFAKLWHEREDFFKRIAVGSQKKFLKGWLNRLNGIRYECLVCNGGKVLKF